MPEGVEGRVEFKGPLGEIVYQLIGGLRAGMGYVGAKDIHALQTETHYMKITAASLVENHPHDISITKEAPTIRQDSAGRRRCRKKRRMDSPAGGPFFFRKGQFRMPVRYSTVGKLLCYNKA